jgi:hypothetical protein
LGKWILFSNRIETETISFKTSLEAIPGIYPGAIIEVQDQSRSGFAWGGRVLSGATTTNIPIDREFTISGGESYQITFIKPDGVDKTRNIQNSTGTHTDIAINAITAGEIPVQGASWLIRRTTPELVPSQWKVLSITEAEENIYEIVGLEYNPDKFDAVENDLKLEPLPTSLLNLRPSAVSNITHSEEIYVAAPNVASLRITLSWDAEPTAAKYIVTYKKDNDNIVRNEDIRLNSVQFDGVTAGFYKFTVTAVNSIGRHSPKAKYSTQIEGLTALPEEPQNLTITAAPGYSTLRWDRSQEIDVLTGGWFKIKHSSDTSGVTWGTSSTIGETVGGTETMAVVPLLEGTYLVKTIDSGGRRSELASSAVTNAATVLAYTVHDTATEDTTFLGHKLGTVEDSSILKLDSENLMDEWGLVDDVVSIDAEGGVKALGSYQFDNRIDMVDVSKVRLQKEMTVAIVNTSDLIDSRIIPFDEWVDFDATEGDEADAKLYVRTTDTDPDVAQVQTINQTAATSGNFTLTINGDTTDNIAWNASAATLESEIEALLTVSDCTVTGAGTVGSPWVITYVSPVNGFTTTFTNVDLDAGTINIVETTPGPTWSEWNLLDSAVYENRGFDFRLILTSTDLIYNVNILTLRVIADEVL